MSGSKVTNFITAGIRVLSNRCKMEKQDGLYPALENGARLGIYGIDYVRTVRSKDFRGPKVPGMASFNAMHNNRAYLTNEKGELRPNWRYGSPAKRKPRPRKVIWDVE